MSGAAGIRPGDWVTLTLRVQVKDVERIEPAENPVPNPFIAVTYVSGKSQRKGKDGFYEPPKDDVFTVEIPVNPQGDMAVKIEVDK